MQPTTTDMLVTGKRIRPIGTHASVGSYPANMVFTKDRKYAVVTTIGYRQFLSVVRASDGKVMSQLDFNRRAQGQLRDGLYYGLTVDPKSGTIYASRGAQDMVSRFSVDSAGKINELPPPLLNPPMAGRTLPHHAAGLALSSDGRQLLVVNNQTSDVTDYKGSVSILNTLTGNVDATYQTAGYPFAAAMLTEGPNRDRKFFVGSERDGVVQAMHTVLRKAPVSIATGASPTGMILNKAQSRLFVTNNASDTVSIVDTQVDKVLKTILLRPSDMRGLPGAGPQGLCLSPDERKLFVTLSDMNAIAVIDVRKRELEGYLPTGWLPTSVLATEKELLVSCAKGTKTQNPNHKPVSMPGATRGQYIQDIIDGTVTRIPMGEVSKLKQHTVTVIANNRLRQDLDKASHPDFKDPGVKYVVYIIKENRTYDNVLSDLPQGNGDPSVNLFPRKVTPNQHALAERFVLLDNFHVCAEVSQDGWVWSTAGMVNAYASRNTPYNYSNRGRSYDTEGGNSGVPVDLMDIPDVTRPAGGYIWEQCLKYGVSYRNYGFFTQFLDPEDKRFDSFVGSKENAPAKKALVGRTCDDFRRYDLEYADSEAHLRYNWNWPRQRKTFGKSNSPSRFTTWKREFDEFVKKGDMPRFQMVRFGNDHTSGTRAGQPTPAAMVADNDYAVGQLVEAVSKSPFWKETAICILEDDAQNGYDHVDAHRSIAFVISPYIKRGTVDSRFYNTDSMLRTMELLLGMPPMSQYDAVASPIAVFGTTPSNDEPYTAILPAREVVCQVNEATAYRSKDSNRISNLIEEGDVDEDLNDILWGAIKGPHVPRPKVVTGLRLGLEARDED